MRLLPDGDGQRVVLSVSDLTAAASCEFGLLRALDVRLGRLPAIEAVPDPLMERAAGLGDVHEQRVLDRLKGEVGPESVRELPRPTYTDAGLVEAQETTLAALRAGTPVVAQGTVYDGGLMGHPDFLVRVADSGAYEVWDAKLSRSAKVSALLQIAAYADLLAGAGIAVAEVARLELGNGQSTEHRLDDLIPAYRDLRARADRLVADHLMAGPVQWGDDAVTACGRCDACEAEVAAHRDLLLVAGLRMTQRARLRAAGVTTIEQLAEHTGPVAGLPAAALAKLRAQAALQVAQDERTARGEVQANGWPVVVAEVVAPEPLRRLPAPSDGDLFFDFEGDPLWTPDGVEWGLEYLFGVLPAGGDFTAFWAFDRDSEGRALADFLAFVAQRRAEYPQMRIYHYAPYETSALKRLVGQHGVGEEQLDDLLRGGVFVDLYAVVRQALRVSQPSYSLKKLEPLYMAERRVDLDNAGDSVAMFAQAMEAREAGQDDEADDLLDEIRQYNEYDVESTRGLRDWLLALRDGGGSGGPGGGGGGGGADGGDGGDDPGESPEDAERAAADRLTALADGLPADEGGGRGADEQALRMVAASLGYHRREDKAFWWEHFHRLSAPLEDWSEDRAAFIPDAVESDSWSEKKGNTLPRRTLRLVGSLPAGTEIVAGWDCKTVYGEPLPAHVVLDGDLVREMGGRGKVVAVEVDGDGLDEVTVEERLPRGAEAHDHLPVALVPDGPVATKELRSALAELAERVVAEGAADLPQAALDVLRRSAPRTAAALPALGGAGPQAAITAALRGLDRSYLAVQGPPGTGKTHTAAQVIDALVRDGWKVGVVAQSHAVVENLLRKALEMGVPAASVAKKANSRKPKGGAEPAAPWRGGDDIEALLEGPGGCLIGGTAWTFANAKAVPRGALDLLVIDEAGQFSLANTLAVSLAARRLLLLGDPQQLPQVSQGSHPEPVDASALGWLMQGHATLPDGYGYFLAETYRMHPVLTEAVSRLSYERRLRSVEAVTTARRLEGVAPGLHVVEVDHQGRAVAAPEEADAVAALAESLLGMPWLGGADQEPRPLGLQDVLVVAPYNAQGAEIRRRLAAVGCSAIRVGTVDKFQGQEAPVVIVSMTASSPEDVPRGMDFLLSRNRVNVAVSRAQWATYVVRSPRLTEYLPAAPAGLAELGAFLGLQDPALLR